MLEAGALLVVSKLKDDSNDVIKPTGMLKKTNHGVAFRKDMGTIDRCLVT